MSRIPIGTNTADGHRSGHCSSALIERPIVLVADRWYATAEFLRACKALGIHVLIRLKRNRKLYRSPKRTSTKGRPPLDGPLFQASRPETCTGAEAV